MKKISLISIFVFSLFIFGFNFAGEVSAAGAVIQVSPNTGKYNTGDTFAVSVIADGGGTQFNVAQADVTVSSNLQVQNVVFGDCNFSFVTTPDAGNLNFVGAILGGKSAKCTVYTVTL